MNNKVTTRIDSVGSFLPPERLLAARSQYVMGAMDYQQLHIVENEAIENLIDHQIEAGLKEVTSGEFRRFKWDKDFWFGFAGIRCERVESGHIYHQLNPFTDIMRFTGHIAFNPAHTFFDDFKFLYNSTGKRALCRQTLPSPANLYLEILSITDGHPELVYPDAHRLLPDIAEAYNKTILHFYELGCRHLQIDDTACGLLCDDNYTKRLLQGGIDLIALHGLIIKLFNDTIDNVPSDMEISIYISGGDTIVPEWEFLQFPDNIMPKVLSQVKVDKYYLPFDIRNDYQFEVLRHIPAGKMVVLGVADAHSPFAESIDEIAHALERAAKYIKPENLSVSPKTGFKLSSYASRGLTYEYQWQKLSQLRAALNM